MPSLPPNAPTLPDLKWFHWLILVSIDVIGPFSTDSYVPNMPEMIDDLHTTAVYAGLTLQLNWLVKGVGNVTLGWLSDHYGRRLVIACSLVIYVVATFVCSIAPNVSILIAARMLQGVGESCSCITSAIARDSIEDPERRMKMLAILGTIRPVAIISAPSVGGLLGDAFGWRWVFGGLSVWGLLNLNLVALLLPETNPPRSAGNDEIPQTKPFMEQINRIFFSRHTAGLGITYSLILAAPMAMLSNIAVVLDYNYKIPTVQRSLLIGSIPCTMIIAASCVSCSKNLSPLRLLQAAMTAHLGAVPGAFVVGFTPALVAHWFVTMSVFYYFVFFQSFALPPLMSLYLKPVKDISGVASGVQSSLQSLIGAGLAAFATVVTEHHNGAPGLLISIGCILGFCHLFFWSVFGCNPPSEARDVTEEVTDSSQLITPDRSLEEPLIGPAADASDCNSANPADSGSPA